MDENKEKMAFKELKKRMRGDMEVEMYEDDNLFCRFLKARDFNVDNSKAMLREHLEWRKKNDLKNIFNWTLPEGFKDHFILSVLGNTKDGSILKYLHFGNTDCRGISESVPVKDWLRSLVYIFENDLIEMRNQSERLDKLVDKITYIINWQNFSLATAANKTVISATIQSLIMYLNNYPETLKEVYIINGSVFFYAFYSVIKFCIPASVIQKIKIYSDDSWKNDLLEVVDAEVLPVFLGGKRTDPDGNPLCTALLPDPKPVPKSLYLNKSKRPFPTIKDAEKISVFRGSALELFFEVNEPGSYLEWEFEVKPGDIRFGILYKNEDGGKLELISPQRINTSEYTGSGLYKCENIGIYIVVFDNSYSILKSKEIWYKIKVSNPQELIPTTIDIV